MHHGLFVSSDMWWNYIWNENTKMLDGEILESFTAIQCLSLHQTASVEECSQSLKIRHNGALEHCKSAQSASSNMRYQASTSMFGSCMAFGIANFTFKKKWYFLNSFTLFYYFRILIIACLASTYVACRSLEKWTIMPNTA